MRQNHQKSPRLSRVSEALGGTREIFCLSPVEITLSPEMEHEKVDPAVLRPLIASIDEIGLQEPLLVRPLPGGDYRLLSGFHRYFACLCLGVERIPCLPVEGDALAVERRLAEMRQGKCFT